MQKSQTLQQYLAAYPSAAVYQSGGSADYRSKKMNIKSIQKHNNAIGEVTTYERRTMGVVNGSVVSFEARLEDGTVLKGYYETKCKKS